MSEVQIHASVESVAFQAPDTGFAILRCKDKVLGEVTLCGQFPPISNGLVIIGRAKWDVHPKYGEQLKVIEYRTEQPTSQDGLLRYLTSGLIKGIGPALAGELVKRFKADTLRVIREEPALLKGIRGLGPKRADALVKSAQEGQQIEEIIQWLLSHNIGRSLAFRIHKQYGDQSIATLKSNPWVLADEMNGVGFATADGIAASQGLGGANPLRIRAGVKHCVSQSESRGSTAVIRDQLARDTCKLLQIAPIALAESAIDDLVGAGDLIVAQARADGCTVDAIQSPTLHGREGRIAARLASLAVAALPWSAERATRNVDAVLANLGFPAKPGQVAAIRLALASKVMILTGGPGTGKTTTCSAIVNAVRSVKPHAKIVGCALAGKAAARAAEQTGLPCSTIHRLVGIGKGLRPHTQRNPLDIDMVILDEGSTADTMAFHMLLDALPDSAMVLIVGDVDQLPSVGPGAVLWDLIRSRRIAVARLTEITRQAEGSRIVTNAHAIRDGHIKLIRPGHDFDIRVCSSSANMVDEARQLISGEFLRRGFGPNDIQIITAGHKGPTGTIDINSTFQSVFNPSEGNELVLDRFRFRVGDRVLVTSNDRELDVYNGQIGYVREIVEEGLLTVVEGEERIFERGHLPLLRHGYGLTVHKTQGSEFPAVILFVDKAHFQLLDRNWLYTGVTRARSLCALVTVKGAVPIAINNVRPRQRVTLLAERLWDTSLPMAA